MPIKTPDFDGTTPDDPAAVRIRIDETTAANDRVMIHVHHVDHPKGVHGFSRSREWDLGATIRSHFGRMIDAEIERIELVDTAGVGLTEADLLPQDSQSDARGPPEVVTV